MDPTYVAELRAIIDQARRDLAEEVAKKPRGHGTRTGYNRHLREGTPACDECRVANADHARSQREKRRAEDRAKPVTTTVNGQPRTFANRDEYESWLQR
jgi:hypothetical protein